MMCIQSLCRLSDSKCGKLYSGNNVSIINLCAGCYHRVWKKWIAPWLPYLTPETTIINSGPSWLYPCGCLKSHWDGLQYRTPMTHDFEILWGHIIHQFSGPVVRVLNLAHRLHPCCGRLCKWQRLEWWSNSVTGNIYVVGCAKGLRAELKCWFFSNMFLFPHAF